VSLYINGTKDKDLLINKLLDNDIVFLQRGFLSKVNIDSLKGFRTHYTFLRATQETRGRSLGALAIYFRNNTQPILLKNDADILAIKYGNRLRTLLSNLSKQNTK